MKVDPRRACADIAIKKQIPWPGKARSFQEYSERCYNVANGMSGNYETQKKNEQLCKLGLYEEQLKSGIITSCQPIFNPKISNTGIPLWPPCDRYYNKKPVFLSVQHLFRDIYEKMVILRKV